MKEKFSNLIDVKSIMTLMLSVAFVVLALTHYITAEEFLTIFTMIVSFFFGVKTSKKEAANDDKD